MFREKWRAADNLSIYGHTGYLINLAGKGENLEKSITLLRDEIDRAAILSVPSLVLHPGNHKGGGIEKGIRSIIENLDLVLSDSPDDVKILLETTAGQGTSVGHRFEHLAEIIRGSAFPERLGVCLDTCHIFAAGYDLSTEDGYNSVIDRFDSIIGLDRLELVHMNDSKKAAGSFVDRHEHIGQGMIGTEGFRMLLNDSRLDHVDFIMETPVDEHYGNAGELAFVQSLIVSDK